MNTNPVLAQHNKLTESRYNFSVVEKRAVYFIIREVRKQFVEREDGQRDLFDNLIVRIQTKNLRGSDTELRKVYEAMRKLKRKEIYIEENEKVLSVGYINYFEHKKGDEEVEVEVSKKILPYLVELATHFTEYYLTVALSLKNKYSQRFYELCSQWKNTGFFILSIDELRRKFVLEDKYPRYALLKAKVIETARKELQQMYNEGGCDLFFTYKEEKIGKKVDRLKFFVTNKESENNEEFKPDDYAYYVRLWLNQWLKADKRPKNKEWVNKVMDALNLNPDNLKICYDKLIWIQKNKPVEDWAPYARYIVEEDFMNK